MTKRVTLVSCLVAGLLLMASGAAMAGAPEASPAPWLAASKAPAACPANGAAEPAFLAAVDPAPDLCDIDIVCPNCCGVLFCAGYIYCQAGPNWVECDGVRKYCSQYACC